MTQAEYDAKLIELTDRLTAASEAYTISHYNSTNLARDMQNAFFAWDDAKKSGTVGVNNILTLYQAYQKAKEIANEAARQTANLLSAEDPIAEEINKLKKDFNNAPPPASVDQSPVTPTWVTEDPGPYAVVASERKNIAGDEQFQRDIATMTGRSQLLQKITGSSSGTATGMVPSKFYTDPTGTVFVFVSVSPENAAVLVKSAADATNPPAGPPATDPAPSPVLAPATPQTPSTPGVVSPPDPTTLATTPPSTEVNAFPDLGQAPPSTEVNAFPDLGQAPPDTEVTAFPDLGQAPPDASAETKATPMFAKAEPQCDFFFSEAYQQLPKLRLAPDLLVYINRSRTLNTWTGDTFDLNDWLISANGGSGMDRQHMCTLSFYVPRHLETFFVGLGGRFVLRPFNEVEVYAKGRFLVDGSSDATSDAELYGDYLDPNDPNVPTARYYRIYWGFIASITSEWLEGDYQYTVQCAPILRLFQLTHLRQSAAAMSPLGNQTGISPYANMGNLGNPLQIILTVYNRQVGLMEEVNTTTFTDGTNVTASLRDDPRFQRAANRALQTWDRRLKEIQKRTTFYGLAFRDPLTLKIKKDKQNFYDLLSQINHKDPVTPIPINVARFSQVDDIDGSGQGPNLGYSFCFQDFAMANYSPYGTIGNFKMFHLDENTKRIDVLVQMADIMGYEFYQDLSGNIVFKPPFYNMDTRPDAVFNINDVDILSEQIIEDEAQINATNILVIGSPHDAMQNLFPEDIRPMAQVIDLRLLSKYGQRYKKITLPMLRNPQQCHAYAVVSMAKENKNATQINIQIPARPELMLGFPVYLQGRDCFGYLDRVQWSYSAGNDFTFNLSLVGIRRRIYINKNKLMALKNRSNAIMANVGDVNPKGTSGANEPTNSKAKAAAAPSDKTKKIEQRPLVKDDPYSSLVIAGRNKQGISSKTQSDSPSIQAFIKQVGGDPNNTDQWCMEFAQYCVAEVSEFMGGKTTSLPLTASSREAWNKADASNKISFEDYNKKIYKANNVELGPGWIVIWKHAKTANSGHTGILQSITLGGNSVTCVEGNAGAKVAVGLPRDIPNSQGDMELLGFINPWGADAKYKPKTIPLTEGKVANTATSYANSHKILQEASINGGSIAGLGGRSQLGLLDLVPLPNAVLQTKIPEGKAVLVTPGYKEDVKAKTEKNLEEQKVAGEAEKLARAAYEAALPSYNAASQALDAAVTYATNWVNLAETTMANVGNSFNTRWVANMDPSDKSELSNLERILLEAKQDWESDFFKKDSKKAIVDMAQSRLKTFMVYLRDIHLKAANESLAKLALAKNGQDTSTAEGAAYKEALGPYTTAKENLDKAISDVQLKMNALSNIQGKDSGMAADINSPSKVDGLMTTSDDVLDTDPDSQIYVFGQDTFRTPALKGEIDEKLLKTEAAIQKKLNFAGVIRPNSFNPYYLTIDPRMMGRLAPALPKESTPDASIAGERNITMVEGTVKLDNFITDKEAATAAEAKIKKDLEFNTAASAVSGLNKSEAESRMKSATSALASITAKNTTRVWDSYKTAWGTASSAEEMLTVCVGIHDNYYDSETPDPGPPKSLLDTLSNPQTNLLTTNYPTDFANYTQADTSNSATYTLALMTYFACFKDMVTKAASDLTELENATNEMAAAKAALASTTTAASVDKAAVSQLENAGYSAARKVKALNRGSVSNTGVLTNNQDKSPLTPAEYVARLAICQPYTDANGFEQIAGFPWGRTADVTKAADSLRLNAVAHAFTSMKPSVASIEGTIPDRGGMVSPPVNIGTTGKKVAEQGQDKGPAKEKVPVVMMTPAQFGAQLESVQSKTAKSGPFGADAVAEALTPPPKVSSLADRYGSAIPKQPPTSGLFAPRR